MACGKGIVKMRFIMSPIRTRLIVLAKLAVVLAVVAGVWLFVGHCQRVERLRAWSAANDRAAAALEQVNALNRAGLDSSEALEQFHRERQAADRLVPPAISDNPNPRY
jgi:Flp pilus assembly protein TadB